MKLTTLAVLLITAALALLSCDLFTSKKGTTTNPLLGKWKIDSIATKDDSSALSYLLLAQAVNDSAAYDFQFDKDTITFFGKDETEKVPYVYNDTIKHLILTNEEKDTFLVKRLNDSITGFHSRDSGIIYLKRK